MNKALYLVRSLGVFSFGVGFWIVGYNQPVNVILAGVIFVLAGLVLSFCFKEKKVKK